MSATEILEFTGDIGVVIACFLFWKVDRRIVAVETKLLSIFHFINTERKSP